MFIQSSDTNENNQTSPDDPGQVEPGKPKISNVKKFIFTMIMLGGCSFL